MSMSTATISVDYASNRKAYRYRVGCPSGGTPTEMVVQYRRVVEPPTLSADFALVLTEAHVEECGSCQAQRQAGAYPVVGKGVA